MLRKKLIALMLCFVLLSIYMIFLRDLQVTVDSTTNVKTQLVGDLSNPFQIDSLSLRSSATNNGTTQKVRTSLYSGRSRSPVSNKDISKVKKVRNANELANLMSERKKRLAEECQHFYEHEIPFQQLWTTKFFTKSAKGMSICVAPKAGWTATDYLIGSIKRSEMQSIDPPMKVLIVRHPLARLASGYRDKFLNGSPLHAYNKVFKKRTGSGQSWDYRWLQYWFPALISKGLIEASPKFLIATKEIIKAFEEASKKPMKTLPRLSKYRKIAKDMSIRGREVGMLGAINEGYSGGTRKAFANQFVNSSFTFKEFLEFVVWDHDLGFMNNHWIPITEACDPCRKQYKYILHMETSHEESEYILRSANVPHHVHLKERHKSINTLQFSSDIQYYEDVPEELMRKILTIFELDFKLFDYSKDSI